MADCIVETSDGVMLIRLNRPGSMNAMGGTMLQELNAAFAAGKADDRVRAFVVTGEGRAWCAGADLVSGFRGGDNDTERNDQRARRLDPIGGAGRTVLNVYHCDKPTIAAVNGVAVGGGLGLCTAFDIRVASDQARFGTIFIKRALAPDFGLSWFLPRLVGPERAAELFYSGRIINADEALAIGLVSTVVPHERLLDTSLDLARAIAKAPPVALTYTRRALQHAATATLADHLEYEWGHQVQCLASDEFQEAIQAFVQKREPDYSRF